MPEFEMLAGGIGKMSTIMAASSREGKKLNDVVFSASGAAQEAARKYGLDQVINGTAGCFAGDDEQVACIPVVERLYRQLPIRDFVAYAPPIGLPEYRKAAIDETFEDQRPDGYIDAVATAGGTGALHIAIANYSEVGDTVLVADWRWNVYSCLCHEIGRNMATFPLLDVTKHFNIAGFEQAMAKLLDTQDSLLVILNTPANNPTGFSLSYDEWEQVVKVLRQYAKEGKKISLVVDIAYIAYTGDKNEMRKFMNLFSNLPEHIFVMVAFSMSKGYTLYGQRTGALVGISSKKEVIEEFAEVCRYSARTAWSNVNRAAMMLMSQIRSDKTLVHELDEERNRFYHVIKGRADIFTAEAKACGLPFVPYYSGFFISVPTLQAADIAAELQKKLIFGAPLAMGLRLGICSIPEKKVRGLAQKIKDAMDRVTQR